MFIDDCQLVCRPNDLDTILKAVDRNLGAAGARRGSRAAGNEIKSVASLFVPHGCENDVLGWDTVYVQDTCNIRLPSENLKVLGAMQGDSSGLNSFFDKLIGKNTDTP